MKTAKRKATKTFSFTLVYEGIDELTSEITDPLFEAGCDDALVSMRAGIMRLDFARSAGTFCEALLSAIAAVEGCKLPIQLVRVEPL